jgi:16S rRNA (guanine527-N7)-methyltransferase
VVLLEAERRKCAFLEAWAPPNARVVWGRAEEQGTDWAGAAVAKALAHPPVAAEWCLPLVRPGGIAVLWVGESAEPARVERVAERLAAELVPSPGGLLVLRKLGPTPPGFPRRTGLARKRPLA